MKEIILAIIVALIIIYVTKQKKRKRPKYKYNPNEEWPFIKKKLQTKAEEALYKRLREALPDHHIFVQVQASRVISIKKGNDYQKWFNRINRMSLDYVICDATLRTVAVIELDDASHNSPKRQEADAKKDKAIKSAGIKIIRWKQLPRVEEIKATFTDSVEIVSKAKSRAGQECAE